MLQQLKPTHPRSALSNKRSHHNEKPGYHNEEEPALATAREKPTHSNKDPTQPKRKKSLPKKITVTDYNPLNKLINQGFIQT